MRICLYTETALPKLGGQELVVDALARQLVELGHEPTVLAPYPKHLRIEDHRLPYRVVRHLRFYSNRYLVGWYRHWLVRFQKRYGWQVWHCHSVYPCGYLAALAANRHSVPFVITSHGGDIRSGNVRLRKPGLEAHFKRGLEKAAALIAISSFTDAAFRRLHPIADRIVAIPNGVDLEPFAQPVQRPLGIPAEVQPDRFVLFLGRLHHRKGVDILLEAFRRTRAAEGFRLVLAGNGDDRNSLVALAQRLELAPRVHFVGAVSGSSKTWLLQNARVTVVPSRSWEAFPLVVLESFAAARPVIASDLPGLSELIQPGTNGLIVPPECTDSLAGALNQLLGDWEGANRMGQEARRQSLQFSWRSIAQRHLELYEQVIEESAHAAHASSAK